MGIEEDIKQKRPFKNAYQKAGVNLMYTYGWYTNRLKAFFKKHGITPKQYNILRILKGAGKPVSTSFVRERLLDKMSDVSRIVDRMHDKDYLTKSTCSSDKRLVDLGLTPKSEKLLEVIQKDIDGMQKIMNALSEKEIKELNRLLDKMRGN